MIAALCVAVLSELTDPSNLTDPPDHDRGPLRRRAV
jgi:hypothetical protein